MPDEPHLVSKETFRVRDHNHFATCVPAMLTRGSGAHVDLSGISTCHSPAPERKLKRSDGLFLLALPSLFAGSALLFSTLDVLYDHGDAETRAHRNYVRQHASDASRLIAAIELLWITIYCVKGSFLLQFKFHKPPYSLVSANLTIYYWVTISVCTAAFLCTLAVPPILCQSSRM